MSDLSDYHRLCPNCGAADARRLGECSVCGRIVCDECGAVQIAKGVKHATHTECLQDADHHFTMIKFVR